VVCGPDVARHVDIVRTFADGGFTHIYLHQVGPDQDGFFDFFERELGPALRQEGITG
jgi:hypothetical protein